MEKRFRLFVLTAFTLLLLVLSGIAVAADVPDKTARPAEVTDPLVRVLVNKGILTADEASALAAVPAGQQQTQLVELLVRKGVLSTSDLTGLTAPASNERLVSSSSPATLRPAVMVETVSAQATQAKPAAPAAPPAPAVIPAIAPIRVFQTGAAKQGGLIPDIKLGSKANLKLYGFFKTSAVYDTSNQQGNDFPLPGFLGDTGPGGSPEFHLKARSFRVGANFDWPDATKTLALTGRIELDFEGNFTRVNNRNISSIRSSQPSIRLAWMRLDKTVSDHTSVFALFGQDWTPFGSSTLPSLIETTALGIGFGTLYERAPQIRVGFNHNLGGSRNFSFQPEFAMVLPAFGNLPPFVATQTVTVPACAALPCPSTVVTVTTPGGNLGDQLGYGERQGVDSQRPEVQGRLQFQWQLDKAKGVAPAQIIFSGMQGARRLLVPTGSLPTAAAFGPAGATVDLRTLFPQGVELNSDRWGATAEIQLPTRYVTLIAKYYNGTDLRFYFAGQIYSEFNDTSRGVLAGSSTVSVPSLDGNPVVFARDTTGSVYLAPQQPARSQGGFVNLGFPLSRIFEANPEGRNAGWTLYLHYGYDQVMGRDVVRLAPTGGRAKGDLGAATLQWKINPFVTFAYEGSYYRTRAHAGITVVGGVPTVTYPLFRGSQARTMHDFRSEFSTIFTF